jgi:tetratricopeptide (TPR) repeat protein
VQFGSRMEVRRPPWPSSTGSSPPSQRPATFRVLRAGLLFDLGQADEAIAALRALLDEEGLAPGTAGNARVALARMLLADGDVAGARALVEEAVEAGSRPGRRTEDAGGLADRGRPRRCRDFAAAHRPRPRARRSRGPDPDGRGPCPQRQRDLARNFLSRAVEVSDAAPAETIRYAALLLEEDRAILAEELVIDALRRAPGHPELLSLLGHIYLQMEDWSRAEQVEAHPAGQGTRPRWPISSGPGSLRRRGRPRRRCLSRRACRCWRRNRSQCPDRGDPRPSGHRRRGGALSYTQNLLAGDPDNLALKMTLAAVSCRVPAICRGRDRLSRPRGRHARVCRRPGSG